jgi:hypothetical protein
MIAGLFEILMLLCFAFAWPFSIYKSIKSKSTKGKSLLFMVVIILGYICGIANKFVMNDVNYVLYFYFFDTALVLCDLTLYFRNRMYEKEYEEAQS